MPLVHHDDHLHVRLELSCRSRRPRGAGRSAGRPPAAGDALVVEAHDVLAADDGDHGLARPPVARRRARLRRRRSRARRGRCPVPTDSRSSSTSTDCGLCTAWPSSRPAAAEERITESAPLCLSRWTFSASRAAATIVASGSSSRAVRVTSTAASSRSVATITAAASRMPAASSTAWSAGRAVDGHQPGAAGLLDRVGVAVDDDDLARAACRAPAASRPRPGPWCRSR